ncbi:MAG: tetratricopeptide repeat protein, partial [Pirellulales bacterium]
MRTRWEFNRPLAYTCVVLLILVGIAGYLLYGRASNRLAASLKSKAELAASEADWDAEVKWLRRYLQLVPDSDATVIDIAIASNNAVELTPANRFDRVEMARRNLSTAVAVALDAETPPPRTPELQYSLILRLSQYGTRYAPEILDKIIGLNPPLKDPLMLRSFAIAMSNTDGQILRGEREKLTDGPGTSNPWEKLLQMPTTEVLWNAWKANPSDTLIASRLLETLRQAPEQQNTAEKEKNESDFDRDAVAETVIADLMTRPNSGQAQWILFTHQTATAPQVAAERLASQFNERMSRLRQAYEAFNSNDSKGEQSKTPIPILPPAEPTEDNSPRWDYLLAVASVLNQSTAGLDPTTQNSLQTLENLRQLCEFSALEVPPNAIISAYSTYYKALIAQGESKKVLAVLAEGIERLGDESARLHLARLSYLLNSGQLEKAETHISELETLQKKRKEDFAVAQEGLIQERRIQYRSELDTTEWSLLLSRGLLALKREQYDQAIQILRLAMESQTEIPREDRVAAAANLGQAYSRKQLWDLAAVAFERADEFSETRDKYKIMAATAWSKCGNTDRELQLLNALERPTLQMAVLTLR